jgi:hypothetical protein
MRAATSWSESTESDVSKANKGERVFAGGMTATQTWLFQRNTVKKLILLQALLGMYKDCEQKRVRRVTLIAGIPLFCNQFVHI